MSCEAGRNQRRATGLNLPTCTGIRHLHFDPLERLPAYAPCIGTPFGITIDFDTIEKDGTVTLRDRDTCEQRRVTEDELIKFLEEQIDG